MNKGKKSLWKKGKAVLITAVSLILALILFVFVLIPGGEMYSATDMPAPAENWMGWLSGNLRLSEIMIPGTHNSTAQHSVFAYQTKCQWDSIASQLKLGVRLLDLRLHDEKVGEETQLVFSHGPAHCRQQLFPFSPALRFSRVIREITAFLDTHPSETVIVIVSRESSDLSVREMQLMLDEIIRNDPRHWLLADRIPTLREARGKIVLARRWNDDAGLGERAGIDLNWQDQGGISPASAQGGTLTQRKNNLLFVQDRYHLDTEEKWRAFMNTALSAMEGALTLNYLSTAGTANHHPYLYAGELNRRLEETDLSAFHAQWIMMDFATAGTAFRVYSANPGLKAASYTEKKTEYWNLLTLAGRWASENFVLCFIFLILFTVVFQHRFVGKNDTGWIIGAMIVVMVLSIADFMEYRLSFGADYSVWRLIFSIIGYALRPVTVYLLCRTLVSGKKVLWACRTLLIINLLVYLTAFFSPLAFRFTEENVFERGPLGYCSHLLSFIMVILLMAVSIRRVSRHASRSGIVIVLGAGMCVLASILQTLNIVKDLLNLSIGICSVFFFLHIYVFYAGHDQVTGLPNRQSYYEDWKRHDEEITALMFLDMNGLKKFNDSEGHDAGDRALRRFGEVITSCLNKRETVYRIGGDEFTVIFRSADEKRLETADRAIRAAMAENGCSVSMGYVMREKGADQDTTEKAADSLMYIEKQEYYRQIKEKERG